MPVGKFEFWWEGKKAAYRAWSKARVDRSRRARTTAAVERNMRQIRRRSRRHVLKERARRAVEATHAKAVSKRVNTGGRIGTAAANALPRWLAERAAIRIWLEAVPHFEHKHPNKITFQEALARLSEK